MSENESYTDPRIIKTHRAIREAFVDLLHEKPFAQIAVQDILERAPVNRSTFYKYYSGKSDLAGKMIADFKAEYGQYIITRFQAGSFDVFLNLMPEASDWIHSRRRLILALWKVDTRRHHLYRDMPHPAQRRPRQRLGLPGRHARHPHSRQHELLLQPRPAATPARSPPSLDGNEPAAAAVRRSGMPDWMLEPAIMQKAT